MSTGGERKSYGGLGGKASYQELWCRLSSLLLLCSFKMQAGKPAPQHLLAPQQGHDRVSGSVRLVEVPHGEVPPGPVRVLVRQNPHVGEPRPEVLLPLLPELFQQPAGVVVPEVVVVRGGLVPGFVRVLSLPAHLDEVVLFEEHLEVG